MEMLQGGTPVDADNLPAEMRYLPEECARPVFRNLLLALEYLHGNGILHRDVKPENLVYIERPPWSPLCTSKRLMSAWRSSAMLGASMTELSEKSEVGAEGSNSERKSDRKSAPKFGRASSGRRSPAETSGSESDAEPNMIKLLDFGVAAMMNPEDEGASKAKPTGTPAFYAPEMCGADAFQGKEADIWAAGVSLCQLVGGEMPFDADNMPEVFRKIVEEPPALPAHVSAPLRTLLLSLLQKDPTKRPKMHVLRKDPWLTDQGRLPMPDNVHVDIEIEESEIEAAVSSLGGAVSVVMAVNKLQRNVVSSRLSQNPEQSSTTFGGRVHNSQLSMTNVTSSNSASVPEESGGPAAADGDHDDETGGDGAADGDAPVPPAEPPAQ